MLPSTRVRLPLLTGKARVGVGSNKGVPSSGTGTSANAAPTAPAELTS